MKTDPWYVSALWGRIGAAIWTLASVTFGLTTDQAQAGNEAVTAILAGVGVLLAIWSKIREKNK